MRMPTTALLLLAVGCAARPAPGEKLLGLMNERLGLMHDVARWKWNERRPIDDPERERALLDEVARRGEERGLDPGFVRAFFADQIEAAKEVQHAAFDRWAGERRGRFDRVRDLADLRKEIDRINGELLAALAEVAPGDRAGVARRAEGLPGVAVRTLAGDAGAGR
ncbi:MAG: gamma subclass chorismate mutase AroQ [Gemmataceae bacterium]